MHTLWLSARARVASFYRQQQGAIALNAGLALIPVMIAASFIADGARL